MIEQILSNPGLALGISGLIMLATALLSGSIALGVSDLVKLIQAKQLTDRLSIV